VSDDEILAGIAKLGGVGIFSEPAAAAAFAGIVKARQTGLIDVDDPTLGLLTGSGLKDVKAAMQATGEAPVIHASLDALKEVLAD
jgi:threonine synthase